MLSTIIKFFVFVELVLTITCYSEFITDKNRTCRRVTKLYQVYDALYPLSDILDITHQLPIGYYVKVPISINTKYGDIHIILAENDYLEDNNRCYEFALGGWGNTLSEIRRKDSVNEVFDLVQHTQSPYTVPINTTINIELSVSIDGVVNILDVDTRVEFNLTDSLNAIPVKYMGFAGYLGHESSFTFNCTRAPTTRYTAVINRGYSWISSTSNFAVTLLITLSVLLHGI